MTKGGGAGREYFPIANAAIAISATPIRVRNDANAPSLWAQRSHRLRPSRARQPFSASRSPHSAQKFAVRISGEPCEARGIIDASSRANSNEISCMRAQNFLQNRLRCKVAKIPKSQAYSHEPQQSKLFLEDRMISIS